MRDLVSVTGPDSSDSDVPSSRSGSTWMKHLMPNISWRIESGNSPGPIGW
jgi:hypothetical protein